MFKHLNSSLALAALIISGVAGSATGQSAGQFDGPAELPRIYIKSSVADSPAPGKVWRVKEGDSIQQALNRAACGEVIELQPATTFEGSFELPSKSCDDKHWIVLRTGSPDSVCQAKAPALPHAMRESPLFQADLRFHALLPGT